MPSHNMWRVLAIEDVDDTARQLGQFLRQWRHEGNRLDVTVCTDFADGMKALQNERFDLLILDVRKGDKSEGDEFGMRIFSDIRNRRFMPIIFFTARPGIVRHLESAVVRVVDKGPGVMALDPALQQQFDNGLMRMNRELTLHVERTIREYLWDFVPNHWEELTGTGETDLTLTYLVSRRISNSLDIEGANRLALGLNGESESNDEFDERVHPLRYYIVPPAIEGFQTGDILKKGGDDNSSYHVLLTPWCDLVAHGDSPPKAEYALLTECTVLTDSAEYLSWTGASPPRGLRNLLGVPHKGVQGRQEGRFHFLPGVLDIPDLVIDFQQVHTIPMANLSTYEKIATLDAPYSQSVASWYLRFWGRMGTPDLNIDTVIQNLRTRRINEAQDA